MSTLPVIKRKPIWLYVLGGFVVLIALAYFVVGSGWFVKTVVLPRVASQLNSEVIVEDVSLSPFTSLAIRGLKVTPKGDETLLTAKEIRARYSLLAILRGNLQINEVTLDAPQFTIVQRSPTDSNLAKLLASLATEKKPASTSKSAPLQIDVQNVSLKDAVFRLTDRGEVTEVTAFNLSLDQLKNGGAGKLTLSGTPRLQRGRDQAGGSFKGSFDVTVTPDLLPGNLKGGIEIAVEQATGAFQEFARLAATLQADVNPTEVRDLQLSFKQNSQPFGSIRINGPMDLQKKEARLGYDIQSIDRRVLGLVGAGKGLDLGQTVVSAKGSVDLAQQGQVVASKGRLAADRFSLALTNGTTPVLDLGLDYQVTANLNDQNALVQKFDLAARQQGRSLVTAGLDRPMNISWGKDNPGFRESTFQFGLTNLNLADWKSFIGPAAPAGMVGADLSVQARNDGHLLSYNLAAAVKNLSVLVGSNRVDQAAVTLTSKGSIEDFKSVKVDSYALVVQRLGQTVLNASGLASYIASTGDVGGQTSLEVELPGLLSLCPVPGLGASAGRLKLAAEYSQKAQATNLSATLNLSNFTGRFDDIDFRDYTASVQFTGGVVERQVTIQRANFTAQTGFEPGGSFDLSGRYDLTRKSGSFSFKSVGLSQSALGPFVAASFKPNELKSVAIDLNGTGSYDAAGASAVTADLKVSKLVVNDPTGRLPKTPLAASLGLDASMQGQKLELKKVLLTLDPTARATNQVLVTGQLDLATNNAAPSSMSIRSDGLDLTPYYDLFAGKPAATSEAAPAAPVTIDPNRDPNQEPPPVALPFKKFDGDLNIARLFLRDVAVTNLVAKMAINDGNVTVSPFSLNLNGAPVSADVKANLGVPGYQYDLRLDAKNIPVAPLAKSFGGGEKVLLNGQIGAKAQAKGAGITGAGLRRNLTGNFDLDAAGLDYQVELSKNRFVKILVPILSSFLKIPNLSQSPIQTMSAHATAGGGNVDITEVKAISPAFIATVKGRIQIADILTNSPLSLPVNLALVKDSKPSPLPDFLTMVGTVGAPKTKIDPLGAASLATAIPGLGNWSNLVGSSLTSTNSTLNKLTGGLLGNLLGGETNAPAAATGTQTNKTGAAPAPAPNAIDALRGLFPNKKKP